MVALTITVLLGTTLFVVFKTSMDAYLRAEATTEECQSARIALQRMSEEIRNAILLDPNHNPGKNTKFYGENDYNDYGDRLDFISVSHPPGSGGEYKQNYTNGEYRCDFCEIGYYIHPDGSHLMRYTQTKNVPDTTFRSGGASAELASHVTELNFSYYEGYGSGETAWDSDTHLPSMVWIGLKVQADVAPAGTPKKEEIISTKVYLPFTVYPSGAD